MIGPGTSAIWPASSRARSSSRPCGTTSVTSPMRSARAASITSPVIDSRRAMAAPTNWGSRAVMPPPGRMPTRAWVSANTARSEATRKSQPSAISSPPVNVAPLIAPTMGVRICPVAVMQLCDWNSSKYASPSRWASLRSTPAQNAGSVPVSTTARTDSSASASVSAA